MHNRFEIILVNLDPVKGHEQQGLRPCVIVQNDFISKYIGLYIVAPLTPNLTDVPTGLILSSWKNYGLDSASKILFHQIRVIDETRIAGYIGNIDDIQTQKQIEEKIKLTFSLS